MKNSTKVTKHASVKRKSVFLRERESVFLREREREREDEGEREEIPVKPSLFVSEVGVVPLSL